MLNVYLIVEIFTNWREDIINLSENCKLDVNFTSPDNNPESTYNYGVII